jgi:hypothetical protein
MKFLHPEVFDIGAGVDFIHARLDCVGGDFSPCHGRFATLCRENASNIT